MKFFKSWIGGGKRVVDGEVVGVVSVEVKVWVGMKFLECVVGGSKEVIRGGGDRVDEVRVVDVSDR